MNKYFTKYLLLVILLLPICTYADKVIKIESEQETINPFTLFLIIEGAFAVNSWLASEDPQVYGVIAGLSFPFAVGMHGGFSSNTTDWVALIGTESIAVYNLTIDANKKSQGDIFKTNMIAWHLVMGSVFLSEYLTKDISNDKSISLLPTKDIGAQLVFNYKF